MRSDKVAFFLLLKCLMTSEVLTNECRNDWNIPYLVNFIKWCKSIFDFKRRWNCSTFLWWRIRRKTTEKKNGNRIRSQFNTKKKIIVGFDEARLFLQTLLILRIFSLVSRSLVFFIFPPYKQIQKFFFSLTCHRFDRKKKHTLKWITQRQPNEIVQFVI